eukprot:TRINITY_DN881_c1_g1_i23.p1 TRINITY_DN881_c1_g1~~TRINITY_DN881_c1_g1_i23.p1  ORF type:complete len:1292 (+),score=465.19 TRINITY_DN881_c1_g1_i23:16524-20399(+)
MASTRSSLSCRLRAQERAICATSMLWVRRVRKRSPSWFTKTWVLYSRRRKAVEWTMRSRSRWNSLREPGGVSLKRRPRELAGLAAQGARQGGASGCMSLSGGGRQGLQQQVLRRIGDQGAAQRFDQDELDLAAFVLLVHFHQFQPALGAEIRRPGGQAGGFGDDADALARGGVDVAQAMRQVGRHHHAATDGFAVQPFTVAQAILDGVAEGVAEVEDGAQAAFALVLADHVGLDFAGALDRVGQGGVILGDQQLDVGFDPVEEGRIDDGAVLDHFGDAGREFARGQRMQRGGVGDDCLRLVEGADHVLAQRVVDAGLAADRRIHLRQQGGGHLHEGHAAHIGGCGKAGQVADHATAQGHQGGLAVALVGQQAIEDRHQAGPVLFFLAIGQHDLGDLLAGLTQGAADLLQVQRANLVVGDDGDTLAGHVARQQAGIVQQAATDVDGVAALAQVDVEGDGGDAAAADAAGAGREGGGLVHAANNGGGAAVGAFDDQGGMAGGQHRGAVHGACQGGAAGVQDDGVVSFRQRQPGFFLGGEFQVADDGLYQELHVGPIGLDHEVGHVTVQRVALAREFFQLAARVGGLQQRAVLVAPGALEDLVDTGAQVDDGAALLEVFAILGAQDGAAAGGQHDVGLGRELADDLGFAAAEILLALDLEDHRDGRAGTRFDLVVRIDETLVELLGQGPAYGGLAGSHQADEEDASSHIKLRILRCWQMSVGAARLSSQSPGRPAGVVRIGAPAVLPPGSAGLEQGFYRSCPATGEKIPVRRRKTQYGRGGTTMRGVRKISNSVFSRRLLRWRNRAPSSGISPSSGTRVSWAWSAWVQMPPMTTVPPSSTWTLVLMCLVLIARPPGVALPRLSLLTSTSRITLPSGVIWGVTSSFRLAFLKAVVVTPLPADCWQGISSPCSIRAACWSAVTRRGLETILPRPSASSADSSTLRKRCAAALNRVKAKLPGALPSVALARRSSAGSRRYRPGTGAVWPLSSPTPAWLLPTAAPRVSADRPSLTPRLRAKPSSASTMRASINTWRAATSMRSISLRTLASAARVSVTSNWLVWLSIMALPRRDSRVLRRPGWVAPSSPMPSARRRVSARWQLSWKLSACSGSRSAIWAFCSSSCRSRASISSRGATHSTSPWRRISRPLACRIRSSAWSQGTSLRRRLNWPPTVSLAMMLAPVKSASTCSAVRTSMFWTLSESFLPLYALPAPPACADGAAPSTSMTSWRVRWCARQRHGPCASITSRTPPSCGRAVQWRTGVPNPPTSTRRRRAGGRLAPPMSAMRRWPSWRNWTG